MKTGRRVDVIDLNRKGRIAVVEVKSAVANFRSNRKWFEYLVYCDIFFAVEADFPQEILPPDCGIIMADACGAAQSRRASLRANERQPIAWIYRSQLDSRIFLAVSSRIRYAVILPRIP